MTRRAARLLALLTLLASSCIGGGEPEPRAEDATPLQGAASPISTAAPAAATASPARTPTAAPTATAVPTPTAAPTPEPPALTVHGPLLVLSEHVGAEEDAEGRQVETRRVLVYDLTEDQYWAAFDYRHVRTDSSDTAFRPVQPAGTSLIVWSDAQVRRLSLDGKAQTILFEDDAIRAIKVSPDGSKVAVMHGEPGSLVVLDVSNGDQLLRVPSDHPDLGSLRYGGRSSQLALGDWRDDGTALSITAGDYAGPQAQTAVLRLSGGIRVLAEGLVVSPNLRYAIRIGEIIASDYTTFHAPLWKSLTVLDVDTGRVAWTIVGEDADHAGRVGVQALGVATLDYPETREYAGLWFGPYAVFSDGGARVLDTETGEILPLTSDIERQVKGPVRSTCGTTGSSPRHASACYVQYDDSVVWDGASGWTHYLGLIEVPDGLELRVDLVPVVREALPPAPPRRDEMVGPLLAYEVHGEYEYYLDNGRPDPRATRLVIVRDVGTGRSWLAFTYLNWFAFNYTPGLAQAAHGGFVAGIKPVYFSPDGQRRTLHEDWPHTFRVAPDGRKLVASQYGGSGGPARTVVLAIPSGKEITRLVHDDLPSALGLSLSYERNYWSAYQGAAWTSDSRAILLSLIDGDGHDAARVYGVVAMLDGEVRLAPCVTDHYSSSRSALQCLSSDARYSVRGRGKDSAEYIPEYWLSFDIVDFRTNRLLWTVETDTALSDHNWEWAAADHFAWSSDLFFLDQRLSPQARGRAEVSVLDVTTGEIDVMDSRDYLARFYPPPRATTDCPEHPAHPCRILLDGEVVGEGRWPRIIGFIELE